MAKIHAIIDNTLYASTLHRDFLKVILEKRKEKIMDVAYTRALDFVCKYQRDSESQTQQHKDPPHPLKARSR
ncbi:hypothetical protein [Helicobacter suis]|nr:hypothetical protein [Helicobacter suis]